jgi:riboflavin synthase
MFTGIIKEIGTIASVRKKGVGLILTVNAPECAIELNIDDSVAVNGVCQTVISKTKKLFEIEAVEETLKKTTFVTLKAGSTVNLELPMKLNDHLGGHLVLGHVDTVGSIQSIKNRGDSWWISVQIPKQYSRYVIPVGSIAIDGVSLTIAEVSETTISVSIIPHTMRNTIFATYKKGSRVNLEFDMIGKYIERLLQRSSEDKKLTAEDMRKLGY